MISVIREPGVPTRGNCDDDALLSLSFVVVPQTMVTEDGPEAPHWLDGAEEEDKAENVVQKREMRGLRDTLLRRNGRRAKEPALPTERGLQSLVRLVCRYICHCGAEGQERATSAEKKQGPTTADDKLWFVDRI